MMLVGVTQQTLAQEDAPPANPDKPSVVQKAAATPSKTVTVNAKTKVDAAPKRIAQADAQTKSPEATSENARRPSNHAFSELGFTIVDRDRPPEAKTEGKRDTPDLDNRPPDGPSSADTALWIPRVIFWPLYAVSEYVIRRPLEWIITEAERNKVSDELFNFFTWNDGKTGLVPTFFYDFGFLPSVGLYYFDNDFMFEHNQLRVTAGFWGDSWLNFDIKDRIRIPDVLDVALKFQARRRQDWIYHGEGYNIRQTRTRYAQDEINFEFSMIRHLFSRSFVKFYIGTNSAWFQDSTYEINDGSQPLTTGIARGWFASPTSFHSGYSAARLGSFLALDSRGHHEVKVENPVIKKETGLRLEAWFERAQNLTKNLAQLNGPDPGGALWEKFGAELGAFLDLGDQRILSLVGYVEANALINGQAPPFTELATFNNKPYLMSGFQPGELRGLSASAMSLTYRWPLWVFLEGTAYWGVGNTFGLAFEDFDMERMRMSFGFGLRSKGDEDNSLTILFAWGTETFENGGGVSSFRFVFGSTTSF